MQGIDESIWIAIHAIVLMALPIGTLATLAHQPRTPFRYRFYGNMATIGRHSAIGDFGWMRLKGSI